MSALYLASHRYNLKHSGQVCTHLVFTKHAGTLVPTDAVRATPVHLPHSLGGLVAVVAVELWDPQHGLSQHSQEAQGLHKQGRVHGQVCDVARHSREGQDTLHVVPKAAPVPEVVRVKV